MTNSHAKNYNCCVMKEKKKSPLSAAEKKKIAIAQLKKYLIITLGCLVYSIGISLFIEPSGLSSGGMTGISIIVNHYVPQVSQGLWLLILNVPMLVLGLIFFGWQFLLSTGYATVTSSLLMKLWSFIFKDTLDLLPFTDLQKMEPVSALLINIVVGSVLFGVGMGLIFRMGASTAGTDVIVKLLRKKFRHIRTGLISLFTDMAIVIASLLIPPYSVETMFYTALSVVVFTVVFDFVLYGGNTAKTVFIITDKDKAENLAKRILEDVDTGATLLDAKGAYTREDKVMMMCVVKPFLYPKLRDVVREEDKKAFLIVSSAKEIYGEGYKDQDAEEV